MRNKARSATTRRLLENARYEVLPTARVEEQLHEHVATTRTVTVTASPGKGLEASLALAERLSKAGYDVVPHLAARMISGRVELAEIVDRLRGVEIASVFVPAGDQDPPAGEYKQSLDLLLDLHDLGDPFPSVGITGYPESHPVIHDDVTVGHRVVLHGCEVMRGALIGIGAILLDNALVEEGALVGAMSLVTPGMRVPAGQLVMGQPARVIRPVKDAERQWMAETITNYMGYAKDYKRNR